MLRDVCVASSNGHWWNATTGRLSQTVPRAAPRRKTGHQRKRVASRGKSSIRLNRNFSKPNLYLTAKNLAVEGRAPRASRRRVSARFVSGDFARPAGGLARGPGGGGPRACNIRHSPTELRAATLLSPCGPSLETEPHTLYTKYVLLVPRRPCRRRLLVLLLLVI